MERAYKRYVPVIFLGVLNVVEPLFPKPGHVVIVKVVFGDEARITQPGLPFRTISGILQQALKTTHEGPLYVVVNLIQQFIGTGEGAVGFYGRMHKPAFDALNGGSISESPDLHVAEAVQSEARFPYFSADALQDVRVGLPRFGTGDHVTAIVQRIVFGIYP